MYMALVMRVGSIIKCQAVAHAIPVGLKMAGDRQSIQGMKVPVSAVRGRDPGCKSDSAVPVPP